MTLTLPLVRVGDVRQGLLKSRLLNVTNIHLPKWYKSVCLLQIQILVELTLSLVRDSKGGGKNCTFWSVFTLCLVFRQELAYSAGLRFVTKYFGQKHQIL